jgi:hypothetical protein
MRQQVCLLCYLSGFLGTMLTSRKVLSERTQSDINTTAGQLTAPTNSATPSIKQIHQDPSTLFIDPRLLTGDVNFEGLDENGNSEPTAAVEEAYFDEIVSQRP